MHVDFKGLICRRHHIAGCVWNSRVSICMRMKDNVTFHLSTCVSWPCSLVNMPLALFYGWSSTSSELPNTCTINQQPPLEVLHKPAWVYWRQAQNCLQWRPDRGTAGVDSSSTMIRWTTIDCPERLHAIREISEGCKSWALDRSERVTKSVLCFRSFNPNDALAANHDIHSD